MVDVCIFYSVMDKMTKSIYIYIYMLHLNIILYYSCSINELVLIAWIIKKIQIKNVFVTMQDNLAQTKK